MKMKKLMVSLFIVLLTGIAFAQNGDGQWGDGQWGNNGGGGGGSAPTSVTQSVSQSLNQSIRADIRQTTANEQNNTQSINVQGAGRTVIGVAPQNIPPGELNFIQPGQRDVTNKLPKFGCDVIKPLHEHDCIYDVLYVKEGIKFDSLYKTILKAFGDKNVVKVPTEAKRYQIIEADSTKTWTTGGNIGMNGVGPVGTSAMGGGGGLFPQIGRSKSSNLYTIVIVSVQKFKK